MEVVTLIEKYYQKDSKLYNILINHSSDVTQKALAIAKNHPELNIDTQFVSEAGMLHDVGIFLTHAPYIECFGDKPYMCHGILGAELMRNEGYPRHALVCERHTGAGLTEDEIVEQDLPLPHQDFMPVSIEEQVICFADCFFSKTHLGEEKSVEKVRSKLAKFGDRSAKLFDEWCKMFL
ncbi:HDIG domain-containing metalloprotein [Dysgonomonas sp. 520]|uniref:HDIG domain-containing metalloprotein n=1 Tax=Dysgonomonas sp. 520 TaxID=2302931 RepID=UPI0013D4CC30|nr:HDIG domain-containing metalloprotein [Dysgonomonas sp. 520]NDW10860.1 HDIG domain-containing protein [Dysgonomonas sp. 520]